MKKHINVLLALMTICIVGVVGLQLFWNYQNYQSAVASFRNTANESLEQAVDMEMNQRRQQIIGQFKVWLADTSFISVTCDTKNIDTNTVFHFRDRHPKVAADKGMSFGLTDFHEKLTTLTSAAKKRAIDQFGDRILRKDLENGMIYFYTQRLGDSLTVLFDKSEVDRVALAKIYQNLLREKDINTWITLDSTSAIKDAYQTASVNADLRRPFKKMMIRASIENPTTYFIKSMKWLILSTFVLITITVICFGYTAKMLLSQHKLAELKDNFINNMTHEFNTPIASIKITTDALKTFQHTPEKQSEYLDIIHYQTDKLSHLSAQILNINRSIAADRSGWEVLDLAQIINQSIRDQNININNKIAAITYEHTENMQVYGDSQKLLSVFSNIIDNALKYNEQRPALNVTLVREQKFATAIFSDNGIGIPEEYRQMIFQPFFRIATDNVHNVKGYGLGLSYVRQVVREHGGDISIYPNQPTGSVFKIKLPMI